MVTAQVFIYYNLAELMVSKTNAFIANAALYFATAGTFAYITFFNLCTFFLMTRAHSINLVFKELQFAEPLGEEFTILSSDKTILSKELPTNSQYLDQETSKWLLFRKDKRNNAKGTHTETLSSQDVVDNATQMTSNKIWPTKKDDDSENFHEMYQTYSVMNTRNLSEIGMLFRM